MIAKQLISETIPFVRVSDKVEDVLNWMDVFKISHLPVVQHNKYLGLISEMQILDSELLSDSSIEPLINNLNDSYVLGDTHLFNVVQSLLPQKLSSIAVLDNDKKTYLGVIRFVDLSQSFFDFMSLEGIGGVISLEVNTYDYSLSQIAQIVEGNDAKILSLYVQSMNNNVLEVTLKINTTNLSAILQTFERYNYNVKTVFNTSEQENDTMQERLDMLFKYIDM